jgi:hypothetical protein
MRDPVSGSEFSDSDRCAYSCGVIYDADLPVDAGSSQRGWMAHPLFHDS